MDDYDAAVQLCMIGKNRSALLHRIEQLEFPGDGDDTMDDICEVWFMATSLPASRATIGLLDLTVGLVTCARTQQLLVHAHAV